MSRPPAKTFREVELVCAFLEENHPWLTILALALLTGVVGTVVVTVLDIAEVLIEHFQQI